MVVITIGQQLFRKFSARRKAIESDKAHEYRH